MNQSHTIIRRFAGSLGFNIVRSATTFITVMFLARWLGPADYGVLVFLAASFVAFQNLFDMSSMSAFFTFLSQRRRNTRFITLYWRWVGFQFLISLLLVSLLLPESVISYLWPGQDRLLLVCGFVAFFMQNTVWTIVSQMAEASRESIYVQRVSATVAVTHLMFVCVLWVTNYLTLPLILAGITFEWMVACWLASSVYGSNQEVQGKDDEETVSSVFNEFWIYCKPFIPFVWLSFIQDITSVWMLQTWGGSEQQAYHGIGLQFAAVSLIFTTSILKIFWKEIAEARYRGEDARVAELYFKLSRGLFFISALIAGCFLVWADLFVDRFLGEDYVAGVLPLMLMLIYPVHQSLGQLNSAMLLATENSKTQVVLGIIFSTLGTLVAFIMLSPYFGFQLGAVGLAIKLLAVQFIAVNVKIFIISRIFGWRYDWANQFIVLLICLGFGFFTKEAALVILELSPILAFGLGVSLYIALMTGCLLLFPYLAGVKPDELRSYIVRFKQLLF